MGFSPSFSCSHVYDMQILLARQRALLPQLRPHPQPPRRLSHPRRRPPLLQYANHGAAQILMSGQTNATGRGCVTVAPFVLVSGYCCCCLIYNRWISLFYFTNDVCRSDNQGTWSRSVMRHAIFASASITTIFVIVYSM